LQWDPLKIFHDDNRTLSEKVIVENDRSFKHRQSLRIEVEKVATPPIVLFGRAISPILLFWPLSRWMRHSSKHQINPSHFHRAISLSMTICHKIGAADVVIQIPLSAVI
jgi:hypothetical protein